MNFNSYSMLSLPLQPSTPSTPTFTHTTHPSPLTLEQWQGRELYGFALRAELGRALRPLLLGLPDRLPWKSVHFVHRWRCGGCRGHSPAGRNTITLDTRSESARFTEGRASNHSVDSFTELTLDLNQCGFMDLWYSISKSGGIHVKTNVHLTLDLDFC